MPLLPSYTTLNDGIMKRFCLAWILLISMLNPANAQSGSNSNYSIGLALGRQKVGLPFYEMLGFPPHSSYFLEISRYYGQQESSSWYQTIGLNIYQNNSAGSGYILQTNTGRNLSIGKSLTLSPEGGIGISHSFHPKEIYELIDGKYVLEKDFGKIRPSANLKILLGYQTQLAMIYASYQVSAEFFYNEDNLILPSNFLQIGIRYHLKSSA